MRANLNKLNLIYTAFFICTFIFFTSCPKETCNANFSTSYSNGGMAPENVTLAAHDSSQDSYEWSIDGNPFNGTPQTIAFATSGNFNVTLDVNKGDKSCQESDVIEIRDYPYRGYMTQDGEEVGRAISYFQGDGTLSTMVLADGSEPCIIIPNGVPLNIDGLGGLAYHSAEKKLYVTPNAPDRPGVTVLNCFPNGVAVKKFIGGDDFGIFDFVLDENTNIGYYSIRFGGNAAIIKVDLNNQDLAPEPFHNSFEFGNIFFAFDFANNKI